MIKLQFLGPVIIRKEDGSLDQTIPKGSKRIALLAYLVLAKPRVHHRRDELVALFWPDAGQKSARNSLSNILYHLREALGKDIILNRGSEDICVNSDKVWCDVLAFEKAIIQGDLKKAFQHYTNELLTGLHVNHVSNDFQDWLDRERDTLQNAYSKLCWDLAGKEKDLDNFEDAYHYAQKGSELRQYSKKHQRRYFEFLVEIGKPGEARRAYEQYAERLKTELNTEPSADLRSYIENLDASHSDNKPAQTVSESSVIMQHPSVESDSKNGVEKSVKNKPNKLYAGNTGRLSKTLISNILILIIFVLSVLLIGRIFSNPETRIQLGDKSVAVLPFTYINSADSTDYFSLGITEEILSKLGRVGDLSVTSRTSVMKYQNSEKSIREIAGELGVTTVVEGSVQRHGGRVRITAQLIDAETDRHLWGDTYDRQIENILDIQSEVAARIAGALQTELLPFDNSEYNPQQNVDEIAYQKYLQAKYLLDNGNVDGIVESVDLLKESISIDSTFAPAHGKLALAYVYSAMKMGFSSKVAGIKGMTLKDGLNLALQSSNKALSINQNVVEAYLAQAMIHKLNKNWAQSEDKFLKALSINPNHSDVLIDYGTFLTKLGNNEKALIHKKKAVAVDPLSWKTHFSLGIAYAHDKRYDDAIRELKTSINLGSQYRPTKGFLTMSLLKRSQELFNNGQDEQALAVIEQDSSVINEILGTNTAWKETFIFAVKGDKQKVLQNIEDNVLIRPGPTIYFLLLVGQKETAYQTIEQYIDFSNNTAFISSIFDSVRNEPRFQEMVERDLNIEIDFD